MTTSFLFASRSSQARRGLTLIELVVALGVVGIILGAMWIAAGAVHRRSPISDSVQLVNEIATNVRSLYTGNRNAQRYTTIVSQINTAGFYPDSTLNEARTNTINSWGGTIIVNLPAAPNPLNGFSVEFTLPADMTPAERREACGGVLVALPATSPRNPATGMAWATTNTLPSAAVPPIEPTQGLSPSLSFVNIAGTGWRNATGLTPATFFGAGSTDDCLGFAFYYRL